MNPQGALVVGAAWVTPLIPKPARRRRGPQTGARAERWIEGGTGRWIGRRPGNRLRNACTVGEMPRVEGSGVWPYMGSGVRGGALLVPVRWCCARECSEAENSGRSDGRRRIRSRTRTFPGGPQANSWLSDSTVKSSARARLAYLVVSLYPPNRAPVLQ
jgi:hypothetical protein